jgi:hypothetical protein
MGLMLRTFAVVAWALLVVAGATGRGEAQVAPGGPHFTLTGVVVVEGGGRAWLQEPQLTQNQTVAIRPGESIGAYRLTKVFEDRVEMVGPGGTVVVPLAGVSSPAPVASAPPPRPTPPPAPDPAPTSGSDRVVILPPGPPLAPLPPGTPRVDFGSLLRGGALPR